MCRCKLGAVSSLPPSCCVRIPACLAAHSVQASLRTAWAHSQQEPRCDIPPPPTPHSCPYKILCGCFSSVSPSTDFAFSRILTCGCPHTASFRFPQSLQHAVAKTSDWGGGHHLDAAAGASERWGGAGWEGETGGVMEPRMGQRGGCPHSVDPQTQLTQGLSAPAAIPPHTSQVQHSGSFSGVTSCPLSWKLVTACSLSLF